LITLPGFYDDVLPMDDEERLLLAKIPRDEELTLALSGAPELWGDERYTLVERTGARPSLDVLMIQGGARKSAIPASVSANISLRLVPNQNPQKAFEQLHRYIEENAPSTVTWKLTEEAGSQPTLADRHSRWNEAMSRALIAVWQKEPLYDRLGGSIPAVSMLNDLLNIESVLIGVYRPGDNLHAPNEKLHLPTWEKMIETIIYFLEFAGE
ncbi:MAG: peptidase dimerization domain-containing protein, partial [Candidatus Promineifilaceae bacterium]